MIIDKYQQAKQLGITLTSAEIGTELCEAWEDRVDLAIKYWDEGNYQECQSWIEEANRYAI
jgi:hypothetical protein